MCALGAMVLGSHLFIAVADGVPNIDINKMCRTSVQGSGSVEADIRSCVNGQTDARDQLLKQWAQFQASDRARCVSMATTGYLPSYVELLTCLEMFRDAKITSEGKETAPASLPKRRR